MNCEQYRDMLPLYASGVLDPAESETLEKHLGTCPHCRDEHRRLSEAAALLASTDSDSLTDVEKLRLENQIYRRLAEKASQHHGARKRTGLTSVLVRVAAALLVFFLGFGARSLVSTHDERRQPTAHVIGTSLDMIKYRRALATRLRFSPEGLKIIAKGKSALTIETEKILNRQ